MMGLSQCIATGWDKTAGTPLVVYTHCNGHCLNRVVAGALRSQNVRNTIDTIRAIGIFLTQVRSTSHYFEKSLAKTFIFLTIHQRRNH